jgi:hypothetical protein
MACPVSGPWAPESIAAYQSRRIQAIKAPVATPSRRRKRYQTGDVGENSIGKRVHRYGSESIKS